MGFFDIFKSKKILLLPDISKESQIEDEKANDDKIVKVFSSKRDSEIEYSIQVLLDGALVNLATVSNREKDDKQPQTIPIKTIAQQIESAVRPLSQATNPYSLDKARKSALTRLEEISNKNPYLTIDESAEANIYKYKSNNILDYNEIEGLPKRIDFKNIPPEKATQYEKQLKQRLSKLDSIKTPEDAYQDKENLEYYMRSQEKVPLNALIDANIQAIKEGEKLDEETIKKVARQMETLDNEDGALYSVYLKIEEKRIWNKIRQILLDYCDGFPEDTMDSDVYLIKIITRELDSYVLPDTKTTFSPEILDYIIKQIKEEDIENYMKNAKDRDVALTKLIFNRTDIPNKTEIQQFLYARIGSLGQLSYRSQLSNNGVLRNFVAYTDFKDENKDQTKEFLLLVSQIEKYYAEKQYEDFLEQYPKKQAEQKSFKQRLGVNFTPSISKTEKSDLHPEVGNTGRGI